MTDVTDFTAPQDSSEQLGEWAIDPREDVLEFFTIEGNISSSLEQESNEGLEINIQALKQSGLEISLLRDSDTELSASFGEGTGSFEEGRISMFWEKYSPLFHLEFLKREGKLWIKSDYNRYTIGDNKKLLDLYSEFSADTDTVFKEWVEKYSVIQFALDLNVDSGDYRIFIASDEKGKLLNVLSYVKED